MMHHDIISYIYIIYVFSYTHKFKYCIYDMYVDIYYVYIWNMYELCIIFFSHFFWEEPEQTLSLTIL